MRNFITVALLLAPVTGFTLLPTGANVHAEEIPATEAPAAETPPSEAPAAETPPSEAPAAETPPSEAPAADASGDILSVAANAGSFKTLEAALEAAGLVETLKGDGPFTVFAPTDEAFAALPEGVVQELLKPENKNQLAALLSYHVVPGKVMAADIKPGEVATEQGSNVTIAVEDGKVKVNNASVVSADLQASNGVIHVVDQVILPPSYPAGGAQQEEAPTPEAAPGPEAAPAPEAAPGPEAAPTAP
ncbi:MAG: fasciclin domain-containing protein [Thermosynechococcaceae cyanobacterium]